MNNIEKDLEISVTDMHTGGMPVRIARNWFPSMEGKTILEKLQYTKTHFDEYRGIIMREPRGHSEQYGALLIEPDLPEADIGALFVHNEGYSTMCGHVTIGLGRYIVDNKLLKDQKVPENGVVKVNLQCPCGLVKVHVEVNNGCSGYVSFISVPAFLYKQDLEIHLDSYGDITIDISYGGAFFAIVDINQVNMDISKTPVNEFLEFGKAVMAYIRKNVNIKHPFEEELSYLTATMLTDGEIGKDISKNLCIYGEQQLDRSPSGSRVTARMASQFAKGKTKLNQHKRFINSKTGSEFTTEVVETTKFGEFDAIRVKVGGHAFYTGSTTFVREPKDFIRKGFLVQ